MFVRWRFTTTLRIWKTRASTRQTTITVKTRSDYKSGHDTPKIRDSNKFGNTADTPPQPPTAAAAAALPPAEAAATAATTRKATAREDGEKAPSYLQQIPRGHRPSHDLAVTGHRRHHVVCVVPHRGCVVGYRLPPLFSSFAPAACVLPSTGTFDRILGGIVLRALPRRRRRAVPPDSAGATGVLVFWGGRGIKMRVHRRCRVILRFARDHCRPSASSHLGEQNRSPSRRVLACLASEAGCSPVSSRSPADD